MEFRMVDTSVSPEQAQQGRAPPGRFGRPDHPSALGHQPPLGDHALHPEARRVVHQQDAGLTAG